MSGRKRKTEWTDEEIVRSYLEAADREKQIGIIAELNDCDQSVICAVLGRAGYAVKLKLTQKKKRKYVSCSKKRMAAGFARGHRYMLENDGVMYTADEVAKRHNRSKPTIRRYMRGVESFDIDGWVYKVRKYNGG